MRVSNLFRQADGSDHSPVWARTRHRRGHPLVNVVVVGLALFGVLTAALGIKERSLADGGALMDGWIAAGVTKVKGGAPQVADRAGEAAGVVAEKAGNAAQAGAAAATDELKKP